MNALMNLADTNSGIRYCSKVLFSASPTPSVKLRSLSQTQNFLC